ATSLSGHRPDVASFATAPMLTFNREVMAPRAMTATIKPARPCPQTQAAPKETSNQTTNHKPLHIFIGRMIPNVVRRTNLLYLAIAQYHNMLPQPQRLFDIVRNEHYRLLQTLLQRQQLILHVIAN